MTHCYGTLLFGALWGKTARQGKGLINEATKEKTILKKYPRLLCNIFVLSIAVLVGMVLSWGHGQRSTVHAQDRFSGVINCITVVPKSWGDFKGGSAYGLAFQDKDGNVRFVLHPSCGSMNSPAEPPAAPIDLEVERR